MEMETKPATIWLLLIHSFDDTELIHLSLEDMNEIEADMPIPMATMVVEADKDVVILKMSVNPDHVFTNNPMDVANQVAIACSEAVDHAFSIMAKFSDAEKLASVHTGVALPVGGEADDVCE